MRKFLVVVSFLWIYSIVLFSREIKLTVYDKPLNTVLGMLGIEVSFDDAALAIYNVSVSKTFETPEEALHYLLNDKPFKIEKINSVYIIIPDRPTSPEPFSTTATDKACESGYYYTAPIPLEEVIITANHIYHTADRTSYYITPTMRQGIVTLEELLDKIPEVNVDKSTNLIKVNNSKEVLLLADGIPQPADYIKKLPPERIQSIEIIHEPSGRFVSGNYSAIINFILKKDYKGYDMFLSNFSAVNLSNINKSRGLVIEQPELSLSYTRHKMNMYMTYTFNHEKQDVSVSKDLSYHGIEFNSIDAKDAPTDFYRRDSHILTGGVSYQIAPTQMVGIQGDYTSGKTNTLKLANMISPINSTIKTSTENNMTDDTFIGTIFYKGQINDRLHLYSDFSYNYYFNDINNEYLDIHDKKTPNRYNEFKNHTLLNIEGKYHFLSDNLIQAGYSHAWRKYSSEDSGGEGFLDYSEYRNKAFAYLTVSLFKKLQGKVGTAIEHIKMQHRDVSKSYFRFLPYIQANLNVNEKANIRAGYSTTQHYPLLYQLSPMSTVIDSFLIQIGNPELKIAVRHQASLRFTLWNRLLINSVYQYTGDEVSEIYSEKMYQLYRTFENIRIREYSLQATYDQPIGKYIRFRNSIMYYVGQAVGSENKKKSDGWLVNSELSYFHPVKQFGFRLSYHRNMKKHILAQGFQMFEKDNWLVSANKMFLNNRMSVVLSYIPPVSWGIRHNQSRELETSSYKEKTNMYLKSYNNMLLLKVSLRINRGNNKPVERLNPVRKDEREKQTIELTGKRR